MEFSGTTGDALPHQNASESRRRNGALGPGLQSDTGHEHRRGQAVDRCDRGLRYTRSWLLRSISIRPFLHGQDPGCVKTRSAQNSVEQISLTLLSWLGLRHQLTTIAV